MIESLLPEDRHERVAAFATARRAKQFQLLCIFVVEVVNFLILESKTSNATDSTLGNFAFVQMRRRI